MSIADKVVAVTGASSGIGEATARLAAMAAITAAGAFVPAAAAEDGPPAAAGEEQRIETVAQHPYVGMWVTADGRIRQELLANGRYDEARGKRRSAYRGRYEVRGNHIDYWDDTGFTADGTFVSEDELHHGGMVFYRER